MQAKKVNQLIEKFLEAVDYDTKFLNDVLFNTAASYTHAKFGVFRSLDSFRSYLNASIGPNGIGIYVGDDGGDDFNVTDPLGGSNLYFRNLDLAVKFCSIFGIMTIILWNKVTIKNTIDISNKSIKLRSENGTDGEYTELIIDCDAAFEVSGTTKVMFEGQIIRASDSVSDNNFKRLFKIKENSCTNLDIYFKNFVIWHANRDFLSLKLFDLDVDMVLVPEEFSLITNIAFNTGVIYTHNSLVGAGIYLMDGSGSGDKERFICTSICVPGSGYEMIDVPTNTVYTNVNSQFTLLNPDLVQTNTFGAISGVPTNILVNDKKLANLT